MPETTDRRSMLAEAFNRSTETEEEPTETPEAPAEEAAPEPEQPAEVEAAAETEEQPSEQHPEGGKPRDEKGRFQPQKGEKAPKAEKAPRAAAALKPVAPQQPAKPVAAAPATPEKPAAPSPADRPPQSWTAQAREVWKDLPPVARQEIHRLEGETRRVLQTNAELKRVAGEAGQWRQQVESNLKTWEPIFRAEGTDSLTGALSVVQTYGTLHFAPPQQKAAILLGLIERFSNFDDINAVAEARAQGRMPQAAPQQYRPAPAQQPQQDPRTLIREELQSFQQQAAVARAERDYDAFLATSPEFIDAPGVQEAMQTVLDAAASRGRNLTYEAAYDLALKMDPGIQGVLEQRAQAAAIAQPSAQAPTARARVAAATIRSKPGPSSGTAVDPNDRRAMLQRALESGR